MATKVHFQAVAVPTGLTGGPVAKSHVIRTLHKVDADSAVELL